jgi:ketosteroid isomerase-like protein
MSDTHTIDPTTARTRSDAPDTTTARAGRDAPHSTTGRAQTDAPRPTTGRAQTDAPHPTISRAQMNALADGHFRAEEARDIEAIVAGFTADAEHDVAGRPGGPLHGGDQIAGFYRALLDELRIDRFEPVRRWYGDDHVVDESVLHATADGHPFGLAGRGRRVQARFLHIFDFRDGLISRESAWIDLAAVQQQLG